MYEQIVASCRYLLNNYHGAEQHKSYLDSRLNEKSQEMFQFGYFPGPTELPVLMDLVDESILKKAELYNSWEIEDSLFPRKGIFLYFEDHPLIMTFRNTYGEIGALVGRTLLNDEERAIKKIAKYKNTKNNGLFKKGHSLFGLFENKQNIIDKDFVYVVEGQMDVIKAMEIGIDNIVALGTSYMTSYQFSVINRYTNNIILLLDNDPAGEKGRKKIIDKFGNFANIKNQYVPEQYKDIDECIVKENISDICNMQFSDKKV